MRPNFIRCLVFAGVIFSLIAVPPAVQAQRGGICSICNLPVDGPEGPEHRTIGQVAQRIELQATRTRVAAERIPVSVGEFRNLRVGAFRGLIDLIQGLLPSTTITTQDLVSAKRRKINLHKLNDPSSVKAIVDADSLEPLADGAAVLNVLKQMARLDSECKGRAMTIVLAHKGLGDATFLDTLLKQIEAGVYRGEHLVIITCVPDGGAFRNDELLRWLEWQHKAISVGGASSVLMPTREINPLAFTLAMLRMCKRPDLAGAPASPLEMLTRLYEDAATRMEAILEKAEGGAGDQFLRNQLRDAFGDDALKLFSDPIRPGRIDEILNSLEVELEQFLEFVELGGANQNRRQAS